MQTNETYGITVEDLEKAASVRLFEKAAAAEGINLAELSESQVEDLYAAYQQHSSEDNTPMNDELIDLFEKQAAYEGVDLDGLSDDELAYVFNNFVENISDDSGDYGYEDDYQDDYEEEEAYEKLAEAEILGRHMARAYMDEIEKNAFSVFDPQSGKNVNFDASLKKSNSKEYSRLMKLYKAEGQTRRTGGEAASAKQRRTSRLYTDADRKAKAQQLADVEAKRTRFGKVKAAKGKAGYYGKKALQHLSANKKMYGLGAAGLGLGAAGAYAMNKEATFNSILDERVQEFIEFGKEAGYDGSYMDDLAIQVLEDLGYDLSPLY